MSRLPYYKEVYEDTFKRVFTFALVNAFGSGLRQLFYEFETVASDPKSTVKIQSTGQSSVVANTLPAR